MTIHYQSLEGLASLNVCASFRRIKLLHDVIRPQLAEVVKVLDEERPSRDIRPDLVDGGTVSLVDKRDEWYIVSIIANQIDVVIIWKGGDPADIAAYEYYLDDCPNLRALDGFLESAADAEEWEGSGFALCLP